MSHGKPVDPLYRPYLDSAVAWLLKGNPDIRASTVESYEARLVSVINRLESMRLPVDPAQITPGDGRCFIDELFCEGLDKGTISSYAYALRSYAESVGNSSLAGLDVRAGRGCCHSSLSRKEAIKL